MKTRILSSFVLLMLICFSSVDALAQKNEAVRQLEAAERSQLGRLQSQSPRDNLTGQINGYEWVDLGLSVKWATCNVGASSPEQYGDYFAWGEISTKSEYGYESCKTYQKDFSDISGGSIYDAARANWGGSWRMPTKAEFEELQNNCQWDWTGMGGHYGYKVTSKKNGQSIFLPAAGYMSGTTLNLDGKYGHYWSSTPLEDDTINANMIFFYSDYYGSYWFTRNLGQSIRPVTE